MTDFAESLLYSLSLRPANFRSISQCVSYKRKSLLYFQKFLKKINKIFGSQVSILANSVSIFCVLTQ